MNSSSRLSVCVLFGGVSPEHAVSLRSAESVLSSLDAEKYNIYPVGISQQGQWILYGSRDYSLLPSEAWLQCPENCPAILSPSRGQGLLCFDGNQVRQIPIDVIFPVLHGANGEDGSIQGLAQVAGIPCVGSGVGASAAAMDKFMTKLVADSLQVAQAAWMPVLASDLRRDAAAIAAAVEHRFSWPVFVKPAGTGSSVGVNRAEDRDGLFRALEEAARFDEKILVEEFIPGQEVEVAVLGNREPVASIVGEIDTGAGFYDYSAKYLDDSAGLYVPARISDAAAQTVRETAVRIYKGLGCRGLSRVDFFVKPDGSVIFNEINSIPGFTSISMYPRLFVAGGMPYPELLDRLLALAMED